MDQLEIVMPEWIAQSRISSVTDRTRAKTAYLAPLRDEVAQAVQDYFSTHPAGEEVTLAAFARVGCQRLKEVAGERNFDTAKQDFGTFVVEVVVDTFGASMIYTYRSGEAVAPRRVVGWPELDGLVTKFTPHRLLTQPVRIVLDTSAVRTWVRAEAGALDMASLASLKGNHPVSIADSAVIELVHWFQSPNARRSAFPHWSHKSQGLTGLLDPDMPIAPGGHEAAALAGLGTFKAGYSAEGFQSFSREVWSALAAVKSANDLHTGHTYRTSSGRRASFNLQAMAQALSKAAQGWAGYMARMKSLIPPKIDDVELQVSDVRALLEHGLLASGDFDADQVSKLELVACSLAQRTFEAIRGYTPDPAQSNDALDFNLLFILPLPAVICTNDLRFIRWLRQLPTNEAEKVMSPTELFHWLQTGAFPGRGKVP